jgi:heptaprenyl diphosphate synthase
MVLLALFIAVASVLHVVESWIPLPLPVPGVKLGLANVVSLAAIVLFGWREALYIAVLRVFLGSFFGGTMFGPTFIMSFCGAMASTAGMYYIYRNFTPAFSLAGVSVAGAVLHNMTQILVVSAIVSSSGLLWYIPYLLLFAVPTGLATGITVSFFIQRAPLRL